MSRYEIGFIGCGNMGGALIKAVAANMDGKKIAVYDTDAAKAEKMQEEYKVCAVSLEELAKETNILVLGVKPQVMEKAIAPIKEILQNREGLLIVTMAAGLPMSTVLGYIGKDFPIIRIMPNTPVSLGLGTVLYCTKDVSKTAEENFVELFSKAGTLYPVTEAELDAGGALSGCGPAFVYAFAEGLIEGAMECGISQEKALAWTTQTLIGAAQMLKEHGDPAALRKAVCSPGGTTLAGLAAMQDKGFHEATKAAIHAAYKRTMELKG